MTIIVRQCTSLGSYATFPLLPNPIIKWPCVKSAWWLVVWLVVLFCSLSTLFGSFNAELNLKLFSINIVFVYKQLKIKSVQLNVKTVQLNVKTVLFQTIQFCISTQFSSIWPIDWTLSGATTTGLSRPGSDGNKGVLCIPQSSIITGTSPSDCLVIFTNPSARVGYDTRSIFKRSLTGLNSEFSFS